MASKVVKDEAERLVREYGTQAYTTAREAMRLARQRKKRSTGAVPGAGGVGSSPPAKAGSRLGHSDQIFESVSYQCKHALPPRIATQNSVYSD